MKLLTNKELLFTPGPTPTPEFIRKELANPTIHHRTSTFEGIMESVRRELGNITGMKENIILASTGTGAMEACITNFSKKVVLVVNHGKFGERFGEVARSLGRDVVEVEGEWDTPVNVEEVRRQLELRDDIDCVCFQICESSGGLEHPYESLASTVKSIDRNVFVIADGITAMGTQDVDVSHIDCYIGGSQKAFMLPPGVSFIGLSDYAIEYVEKHGSGYYFNLKSELTSQRKNTTAYTAATTTIIGLKAYFEYLEQNGLEMKDVYEYTTEIATATRAALSSVGLAIYPKRPASSMTACFHNRAADIKSCLEKKYSVHVAGGQGKLEGKIIRINHMGFVPLSEICFCVSAVELALSDLGIRRFDGDANRVFLSHISKAQDSTLWI